MSKPLRWGPAFRLFHSGPASVALTVMLVAVYAASVMVGREQLEPYIVAGVGHGWWTVFTAVAWPHSLVRLITELLLLLTVGIWLERNIGSRWYLATGMASYVLGALGAIWMAVGIDSIDHQWGAVLLQQRIHGAMALLLGAASAASVKMSAILRRQIRIAVGTVLAMLLVFSGTLGALFSLLAALIGWGLGFALWGRDRDRRPPVAQGPGNARITIALVAAGVAVGTLVSLHSPDMIGALVPLRYTTSETVLSQQLIDHVCAKAGMEAQCEHYRLLLDGDYLGRRIVTIMPLLMQLVLAWGLQSGRRAAWWGFVALQAALAALAIARMVALWPDVAPGLNEYGHPSAQIVVPVVVPLGLLVVAAVNRRLFPVKAVVGTYARLWRRLGWVTLGTWLLTLVVGVASSAGSLAVLTVDFVVGLLPSSVLWVVTPGLLARAEQVGGLPGWLLLIPWVALAVMLARSFSKQYLPGMITRAEYIAILEKSQAGSMGWSGTWDGNRYWKSAVCEAAIAYRVEVGVALTVSDPAARIDDLEAVLTEFAQFCQEQGLVPALYSVHPQVVRVTDSWTWARMQVAEETVLNLETLEFKGKKFQDIRTALNRAQKEGITHEWTTFGQARPALRAQIKQISDAWLADKDLPEMGFTIGGLQQLDDPQVRILVAVDQEGTVHGVTSWLPIYDRGRVVGWLLDFMRRLEGGFRPVMEYLIATAALSAKEEGYSVMSLSGAPLVKARAASTTTDNSQIPDASSLDQLLDILSSTLEPVYGFHSLLHFKAKFDPDYVPMYLVMPTVVSLPAVGLALLRVFLPGLGLPQTIKLSQMLWPK